MNSKKARNLPVIPLGNWRFIKRTIPRLENTNAIDSARIVEVEDDDQPENLHGLNDTVESEDDTLELTCGCLTKSMQC